MARPAVATAEAVQYVPMPTARTLPSATRYSALDARMSRRQLSNHADSRTCRHKHAWRPPLPRLGCGSAGNVSAAKSGAEDADGAYSMWTCLERGTHARDD